MGTRKTLLSQTVKKMNIVFILGMMSIIERKSRSSLRACRITRQWHVAIRIEVEENGAPLKFVATNKTVLIGIKNLKKSRGNDFPNHGSRDIRQHEKLNDFILSNAPLRISKESKAISARRNALFRTVSINSRTCLPLNFLIERLTRDGRNTWCGSSSISSCNMKYSWGSSWIEGTPRNPSPCTGKNGHNNAETKICHIHENRKHCSQLLSCKSIESSMNQIVSASVSTATFLVSQRGNTRYAQEKFEDEIPTENELEGNDRCDDDSCPLMKWSYSTMSECVNMETKEHEHKNPLIFFQ